MRDGGRPPRRIDHPVSSLKRAQRALHELITDRISHPLYLHGSIKGRSSKTNAAPHRNKACIVKVDVSDFYPSINTSMVEDILRRQLRASRQVARLVAALLTRHDESDPAHTFLPQGSPGSCVIANLVLDRVDRRIKERADRIGIDYTRYVDDIVVSGERARELIPVAIGLLVREGFQISRRKLVVLSRAKSQVVTGVVVNRKLAPTPRFRAGCMALIREGQAASPERLAQIIAKLRGKLSYAHGLEGTFAVRVATRLRLLEMRSEAVDLTQGTKSQGVST